MAFRITLDLKFRRRLRKKPPTLVGAIIECIVRLADNPRHPGLRTHRIQGTRSTWEAYVDRSNRVSWEYGAPDEIVVLNHCNHEEVLP